MKTYKQYQKFSYFKMNNREWPNNEITRAPTWCSVDLRDGNQALINPMNVSEKLKMFKLLIEIGFKEIEVGFPAASPTEYNFIRTLIDNNLIPSDVTIQVLVQARADLIPRTFEAIKGAKNVIVHYYNSTSKAQREVVFKKDMEGIIKIATDAGELIKKYAEEFKKDGGNIKIQYSPESFSATEIANSIRICAKVTEIFKESYPLIINLPATVEVSSPNGYADQIEYFRKKFPYSDDVIISIHPHNDRGTGVAAAELGLLAGATRVEGTLFGNGERTGNVDLITMALNMHTEGIDCKLDLSNLIKIKEIYEKCTKMEIHPRHPYIGDLVFTAFSGSHQDAINKGLTNYFQKLDSENVKWDIPYIPINPADIGRKLEGIIRINSQSGKGGVSFVLKTVYGLVLDPDTQKEFSLIVTEYCDRLERELSAEEIYELFKLNYPNYKDNNKVLEKKKS